MEPEEKVEPNRESHVVVYSKDPQVLTAKLKGLLDGVVCLETVETCNTISDLRSVLSAPHSGFTIVVVILFILNREDLVEVRSMQSLLSNKRLVLLLPNSEAETVMVGHSLYPRYLGFQDSPLGDIRAVLEKMIDVEG